MAPLPKDLVAALRKPFETYWVALGEFIHEFARVERDMQSLLRHVADVSDERGRAIFYGVRVDAAQSSINRIFDAEGRDAEKEALEGVFKQLSEINSMRNNIVHWGSRPTRDDGEFLVSNRFLAHTPDRLREMVVSAETLKAMIQDLYKISAHINMAMHGDHLDPRIVQVSIAPLLLAPWQYKPPQQSARPKPNPRQPRKQRPRRDALPE